MYGICSARSVSATTSLPKPGALVHVRLAGRSSARIDGWAALAGFSAAAAAWPFALVTGGSLGSGVPRRRHRTGSRGLTQPRQELHAGIAVGRLHAHFALEIAHRDHGVVADPPVGPAGVEAERGEALLYFLDFGQRGGAFASGEGLHERPAADDAVAEMHDRQRIIHRGVVGAHGIEVRAEQEGGSARYRRPQLGGRVRLRERLAIGSADTGLLPRFEGARRAFVGRARHATHLIAPMLACAILAALDEILRGAG